MIAACKTGGPGGGASDTEAAKRPDTIGAPTTDGADVAANPRATKEPG